MDSPSRSLEQGSTDKANEEIPTARNGHIETPRINLTDQTNLLPFKKVIIVFLSLASCEVVSSLDSVIVATAISTISVAFNAGSVVSWVPAGFLLTSTVFQPLYGRFSDIFGRKAALSASMVVFMIGNLLSGFSKSITQLIIARAIAGAGGGGITSICQIIIADIVSLRDRGKYQGIIGIFIAFGCGTGPLIGGLLSEKVAWQWCFWITIPIAAMTMIVMLIALPLKPVNGDMKTKLLAIDYLGTALSLTGSTLIILPLIWGGVRFPWNSPAVLSSLIVGALLTTAFCLWEWKGAKLPIVPMHIFRHSTVVGVYIAMFANGFIFFSSMYYIPQYLQAIFGYHPLRAGLFLIANMASQTVSTWVAGIIVSRTGRYRALICCGFVTWSVCCGLIATITASTCKGVIVAYILLSGIGGGMTFQTTIVAAQASVEKKDVSVVTTFWNFIRLLGGALAQAVASSIINNTLRLSMLSLGLAPSLISDIIDKVMDLSSPSRFGLSKEDASFILSHGYNRGFRALFILNAMWAGAATLTSILLIKHIELPKR